MDTFGIRVRDLRTEKNMTQQQLADLLNVRNTTVSAWEKDIAEPNYATLAKIARYFGVSSDYLIGLEDEIGAKPIE